MKNYKVICFMLIVIFLNFFNQCNADPDYNTCTISGGKWIDGNCFGIDPTFVPHYIPPPAVFPDLPKADAPAFIAPTPDAPPAFVLPTPNSMKADGLNSSPLMCRDYIKEFIQSWPNNIPYVNQTHDCDDFANTFVRLCTSQGFICGVVWIPCETGTHAVNIACYGELCCGVEPQGPAPGEPPEIIPGTCFASNGVPKNLTDGQCNLYCQGSDMGKCKRGAKVSADPMIDVSDKPSAWCWNQQKNKPTNEQSFASCCECCNNTWSKNPHGYWGESCGALCQSVLINKEILPVYSCNELGYNLTGAP